MCYNPKLTYPEFTSFNIKTSLFNRIAKNEKVMKRFFFPIGLVCMKLLQVKGYDAVLISSTYCAKYVSIDKAAKIFIYTYTPFRLAWAPSSYKEYTNAKGLRKFLFKSLTSILRLIDAHEAQKGTYHISMTKETVERIKEAYGISAASIIYPPVKCTNFHLSNPYNNPGYYLIVSRLEFYKNVDLAIKAFNKLGYKLVIVGNGSKKEHLMTIAQSNIEFKSGLSREQLADLYSNCKALIFPQHEDYGITPLEANASGRPEIAYGKGGVEETMIPYD
jgi:glycosyltransferase involved in cell wall biosynthesis